MMRIEFRLVHGRRGLGLESRVVEPVEVCVVRVGERVHRFAKVVRDAARSVYQACPASEFVVNRLGRGEVNIAVLARVIVQYGAVRLVYRVLGVDTEQEIAAYVLVVAARYDEIIARAGAKALGHLTLIHVRSRCAAPLELTRRHALARALGMRRVLLAQYAIQAELNELLTGFAAFLCTLLTRVLLHERNDDCCHVLLVVRVVVFERDQELGICPVHGLAQATTTAACLARYPIFLFFHVTI